jgi:hypothetical protein
MFKKGEPRPAGAGRRKGTPNKLPRTLKEDILEAFMKVGGADYLVGKARENPTAFMSLLGRVLPTELSGEQRQDIIVRIMRFGDKPDDVPGV